MKPFAGATRCVRAWPGVAYLGLLLLSPLSPQEPKPRVTFKENTSEVMAVPFSPG